MDNEKWATVVEARAELHRAVIRFDEAKKVLSKARDEQNAADLGVNLAREAYSQAVDKLADEEVLTWAKEAHRPVAAPLATVLEGMVAPCPKCGGIMGTHREYCLSTGE